MRNFISYIATGVVSAAAAVLIYTSYAAKTDDDAANDDAVNCQVCKGSECVGCLHVFVTTGYNPFAPIDCDWWGSPETGSLPCGDPPDPGGGGGNGNGDEDDKAPIVPPPLRPCDDLQGDVFLSCVNDCLDRRAADNFISGKIPDNIKWMYEFGCRRGCGKDFNCNPPKLKPGPCTEPMCRRPEDR
jgi:hypothetical protein